MIARSTSPGVFKWGQVFQRGDLPIFITDLANNPVSPFKVTYTLFYVGSGCARQVGPADRVPVQADVGEYYVSGVAGECAQPGDWLVEWKYQESFSSPCIADRMGFKVFNTAQYLPPVTYRNQSHPCGCSGSCGCTGASPRGACQWGCRNPCLTQTSTPCGGKYGWG